MSNKYFNNPQGPNMTAPSQSAEEIPQLPSPPKATAPMKTAAWPGLPGKTGPDRSAGVKKIDIYPTSKGL